jgi:hypothetical protein
MIGGALARPCHSFPSLFSQGTIWERFPYLLPNLFSAFICLVGVINGVLFLEETHSERKQRRDRGLELGDWLLSHMGLRRTTSETVYGSSKVHRASEIQPLLQQPHDDTTLRYGGAGHTPARSAGLQNLQSIDERRKSVNISDIMELSRNSASRTFTRPVVLNVAAFGILALYVIPQTPRDRVANGIAVTLWYSTRCSPSS